MSVQLAKRLLSVEDYHKMLEAGILQEGDRIELINGEILEMSPINSNHAGHVNRIRTILQEIIGRQAIISVQNPVVLDDFSEPEPDLALLRPVEHFYTKEHPRPEDIFLIIEVADSSVPYDREIKSALYAKAKVPEYWIVNLQQNRIEVYQTPENNTYRLRKIFTKEDTLALEHFAVQIEATQILFQR